MDSQLCVYSLGRHYSFDAKHTNGFNRNQVDGLIRSRDFRGLLGFTEEACRLSNTASEFKAYRQLGAFFKKNIAFADETVCQQAATANFLEAERLCLETNLRLENYFGSTWKVYDPWFDKVLSKAQVYIKNILGPFEVFRNELLFNTRLTSGATYDLARTQSLPPLKFGRTVSCTAGAVPYLSCLYSTLGYKQPRWTVTNCNRVEFVPKSWKTHRAIACEPTGNVPLQLAFDTHVKERLRQETEIDLRSQTRNQEMALEGSINGRLATVDLSMASDTLSKELVRWLLPEDWFQYLRRVRSAYTILDGKPLMYQKFSSMGNGSTFALETLVFASLLHAIGSKRGICYGDDIIVESELYPQLTDLLEFCGFVTNEEKSFHKGPFRESCGKDYFHGTDVTPFYIRDVSEWDKPNLCHNINGIVSISPYGRVWDYAKDLVLSNNLPLVPYSYDTQAGVHITPHHAYGLNTLRPVLDNTKPGSHQQRAYTRKSVRVRTDDSRGLALWFLQSLSRGKRELEDRLDLKVLALILSKQDSGLLPWELASFSTAKSRRLMNEPSVTSRMSTNSAKYQRKWVSWQMPATGTPDHLFEWSDHVIRES